MFLILAIEPDRRQANRLAAIGPLRNAELLTVDSVQAGLELLARHVPDLVLTSMLLSAKDDAALADRLRQLDTAGRQVQTLVIPMFAPPRKNEGGLLARFTKSDDESSAHGCQPAVFAAQINEYLDDLQLDREAREMRQPYSAPAETLYHQPTVGDSYQEVVASVPEEQVIVSPPPTRIEAPVSERSMPAIDAAPTIAAELAAAITAAPQRPPLVEPAPPAPARPVTPPSMLEKPAHAATPSVIKPAAPIEAPCVAEPPRDVEPRRVVEPAREIEATRRVERPRDVEAPWAVEQPRDDEAASIDAPTAEPTRLIAPSPIVEPRHITAKPARAKSIVEPGDDDLRTEPIAEPVRLIAPSPVAAPEHIAPAAVARAAQPEAPRAPVKPPPAVSRPVVPAKVKPKVAKVQFVPPPLHEDPEVAKFMAALNEMPTVDLVESEGAADVAQVEETAAASPLERELEINTRRIAARELPPEPVAPRETPPAPVEAAPKTVKALKPARPRAISPAAAPPSLPPSARKRVTPIRRGASAAAPPDPAPEAPPGVEEPPPAPTSTPVKVVGRIKPAAFAPAAPAAARTGKQKGAPRRPRPVQDEWGLFDPDQAGLPAVQAALEEIEEPDIFRNVSTPPKPRR
jgi:CheY-like chemotaxis protein